MKNRRLYFEKPFRCTVKTLPPPTARDDLLVVAARCSAVSAGTEMLVFQGRFPAGIPVDAVLSGYAGRAFAYPLTYGYSSVGRVVAAGPQADAEWIGRRVFAFQSHQSHFAVPAAELVRVPSGVSDEDAVFLAAMETAVNLVMDGRPVVGEQVLVVGQGVIGLLTTAVLAHFPLDALAVLEPVPLRRRTALEMGAGYAWDGAGSDWTAEAAALLQREGTNDGADLVYELSGQPGLLDTAIAWAGFGARIVVGSWYGTKTAPVDMGGRFHRGRLRLISSQVSTIDAAFAARWNKARRLATAWDLITRVRPSRLISHRFGIEAAQSAYEQIAERPQETLQVVLTY